VDDQAIFDALIIESNEPISPMYFYQHRITRNEHRKMVKVLKRSMNMAKKGTKGGKGKGGCK
jgi:hypothetical protein